MGKKNIYQSSEEILLEITEGIFLDLNKIDKQYKYPIDPLVQDQIIRQACRYFIELCANKNEKFVLLNFPLIFNVLGTLLSHIIKKELKGKDSLYYFSDRKEEDVLKFPETYIITAREKSFLLKIKKTISYLTQKLGLLFLDIFKIQRPWLSTTNIQIPKKLGTPWVWRLRTPEVFFRKKIALNNDDLNKITNDVEKFLNVIIKSFSGYNFKFEEKEIKILREFLTSEFKKTWSDYKSLVKFFGKKPFNFITYANTAYMAGLLSRVSRESGGQSHGMVHGNTKFYLAQLSFYFDYSNCSTFWVSDKTARRTLLENNAYYNLPNINDKILVINEKLDNGLKKEYSHKKQIKKIIIIGAESTLTPIEGFLPYFFYIDFEKKLSDFLIENNYNVVYKFHPDNRWRNHHKYFDSRVKIEYRPFEMIERDYDMAVQLIPSSTVFNIIVDDSKPIFILNDGFHNKHWNINEGQRILKKLYKINATITPSGIEFDKADFLKKLSSKSIVQ